MARNTIIAASIYIEGTQYLGDTTSIQLPELTAREQADADMGMPGIIPRFFGIDEVMVEAEFKTMEADFLTQFGHLDVRAKNYMVRYVSMTDSNERKEGIAEFSGRAKVVTRGAFTPGEETPTVGLSITCVSYKETYDGNEIYDFDFGTGKIAVDGTDLWEPIASAL